MTATVKTVNYTDVQIERMKSVYREAGNDAERKEAVNALAKEFGKTINSIRAKLAGLKVYIKPAKVTKAGTISVTKAKMVTQISAITGKNPEVMDSLESATKIALEAILNTFARYEDIISEYEATASEEEVA